jgi:hypothetical protein
LGIEAPVDLPEEGLRALVAHPEADLRADSKIVAQAVLLVADSKIVAQAALLADGLKIVVLVVLLVDGLRIVALVVLLADGLRIVVLVVLLVDGLRIVAQAVPLAVGLKIVVLAALPAGGLVVVRAVPLVDGLVAALAAHPVDGLRIVDQGQVSRTVLKTAPWRILDLAAVEEAAHPRQIHLPVKRGRISARVESPHFGVNLQKMMKPKDN